MVRRHSVRSHMRRGRRVRKHMRGSGSSSKDRRILISKDTLQYTVYRENGYVIKEPKPGVQPSLDLDIIKKLKGIVPETHLVKRRGKFVLRQKFISGMKGTEKDVMVMGERIKKRGVTPRGLLPQDIIVERSGKRWVIDVGNFT